MAKLLSTLYVRATYDEEHVKKNQAITDKNIEKKIEFINNVRKEYIATRDVNIPGVKEYYSGENILVTGGTGFIGKVLMEKLLRSVPDLGKIYVIVRSKRGQNPSERIEKVLKSDLFDLLRTQRPDALKKIIAISGDMSSKGLDLSPEDQALLLHDVSIVFHAAASIRFDDPLKKAILLNMRGTYEIIKFCKSMKKLTSFVYISTTYCNTDQENAMEKVYPTPYDWKAMIKLAETTSLEDLQGLSYKILGFQPNTYTFTKQMSEKIVDDARHLIPVIIVRLSVVESIKGNPLPGWTDNLNGPSAFYVSMMKGVLRVVQANKNIYLNYIPADTSSLIIIAAAWMRATNQRLREDPYQTDVINVSEEDFYTATYKDISLLTPKMTRIIRPYALRLPQVTYTQSSAYYYYRLITSHILFGLIVDLVLRLLGQKPRLVKIYRKIHHANKVLHYFTVANFKNTTDNYLKTIAWVTEPDFEVYIPFHAHNFQMNQSTYIWFSFMKDKRGTYPYLMFLIIMHYLSLTVKMIIFVYLAWKLAALLSNRS